MSLYSNLRDAAAACALAATMVSGFANAQVVDEWDKLQNRLDVEQNTSWTITRPDATHTYRVVAYGDSIFAGFDGSYNIGMDDVIDFILDANANENDIEKMINNVARRASPYVSGEYLSHKWGTNIEVVRRARSGARAKDIYTEKILNESSHMESENTRVVMFEMCGNDYLDRRRAFWKELKTQTTAEAGTCNYEGLAQALADCTYYMEKSMQAINQFAPHAKSKIIMNLYYPGYGVDNVFTACKDARTGVRVNLRDKFLPYILKSNWRACNLAAQYGFKCADAFAEMMASDYDTNGDGLRDVDALRYRAGESETAYVNRMLSLKSTLRAPRTHYVDNPATSYKYLLDHDVHQSYYGNTIPLVGGSGSGSGPSDFMDEQLVNGQNTQWNKWGHERIGWLMSLYNPATP